MRWHARALLFALTAGLLAALLLSGCRERARKAVEAELAKQGAEGSLRLLEEATPDRYTPPSDGKLANRQVEVYLQVQRKLAGRLRGSNGNAGSAAPGPKEEAGLEERLAREAGVGGDELFWIRTRVVEALLARSRRDMSRSLERFLEGDLAELRRSLEAASDPRSRSLVEERISAVEEEMARARSRPKPVVDGGTLFNLELLSPHIDEIEALGGEIRRFRPARVALSGPMGAPMTASTPATAGSGAASASEPDRGR